MLDRVGRKGKPLTLLVGMNTSNILFKKYIYMYMNS